MVDLPLFPLQTVLFPGMPLHLHIFEERYKRMMRLCLESRQPFGVVLIRQGSEALGPLAEPYQVGCTAQVTQVQRLDEGRLNLVAVGKERFRILSLDKEAQPYLIGSIQPFPLVISDAQQVMQEGKRLRFWIDRYLQTLTDAGKGPANLQSLPDDPISLAYAAAAIIPVQPLQKQKVLEQETAFGLLDGVKDIYRKEIALLKAMLSGRAEEMGSFSSN
ncbi:MAG TPA: LON peptidase substrate-binding domain-containing protein [Anaerolineales bacterium]